MVYKQIVSVLAIHLISNLLFSVVPVCVFAQVNENTIPYSVTASLQEVSAYIKLASDKIDKESFAERNDKQAQTSLKTFPFAERFDVNLNPENSGIWEETTSGKVWRLGISSADAYSIYLAFKTFRLNKGSRMFVYTPGYKELRGAFTQKNNYPSNVLAIAPLAGDHVIIELNLPKGMTEYGSLQLSKVYHDVLNIFGTPDKSSSKTFASTCDENINCENGTFWQTEKRAVCKVISDGALSTGTLVANTSRNNEAYLLTSQHTMFSDEKALEAIFIFNYEYPDCNSEKLNDDQTLAGASIVARTSGLDYVLLKLNEQPPASYRPYYAGWDSRDQVPQSAVSIHHPRGKPKQIAIDYQALATASFGQGYVPNSSWKVDKWEIGFTEPGSSGAPLFNQQHRMIGTLTGGYSSCGNDGSDYFNKLSFAWTEQSDLGISLKDLLDNANTGAVFMDGYDPYGFSAESCDTTWNISSSEKIELSSSGQHWGYISGHNSSGFTRYAEKFTSPGSLLLPGFYMNVARASYSHQLSGIRIKIWEGNSMPSTEVYSKSIFIKDFTTGVNYVALDSIIKVTGNFFIGYEISYDLPGDNFALYHAASRSITRESSMLVYNGAWQNINTFSSINYSTSLGIGLIECYGKTYKPEPSVVIVYPNPSENYINIKVPSETAIDEVACFNTSGQEVPVFFRPSEVNNRILFDLPAGLYILKVKTGTQQFTAKFIVQP